MNVTFHFRSYETSGLIMYHKFTSFGYVKLYFDKSKLLIELQTENIKQKLVLDNFPADRFNDGLWHRCIFSVSTNLITLSVDERLVKTVRLLRIVTGSVYFIGGIDPNDLSVVPDAIGETSISGEFYGGFVIGIFIYSRK